jgi:hypothetical protein
MSRVVVVVAVAMAALAVPSIAGDKGKKPRLEMRVAPRIAFSPVSVLVTAELKGGDDVAELHCPELEWDWDDGGKSVHEADCAPLQPGGAIERRFTAEHQYRDAGVYNVKLTMKRTGKPLMSQSIKVTVRPGIGDRANQQPVEN